MHLRQADDKLRAELDGWAHEVECLAFPMINRLIRVIMTLDVLSSHEMIGQ